MAIAEARPRRAFETAPESIARQAFRFVRDLFDLFGGRIGVAIFFAGATAVVEGAGIVLLIPFLSVFTGSSAGEPAWSVAAAERVFTLLSISTAFGQASALLIAFGAAMVMRSAFLALGDLTMARLNLDFRVRMQMDVVRSLSSASWERISRLRHARITHLLGSDVFRVSAAVAAMIAAAVAAIGLLASVALAFAVNPAMTLCSLAFVGAGMLLFGPVLRSAARLGEITTTTNLSLLNDTGQFLGALKLAVSQNLQTRFVDQFSGLLANQFEQEVGFVRQRNWMRVRLSVAAAVGGAGVAVVGFGLLHVQPATMITLLLLLSRMNGPVSVLQQSAVEFVRNLPAYAQVKAVQADLAGPRSPRSRDAVAFGDITFDNVTFLHPGDGEGPIGGVQNLRLVISQGEFLGVAGPSGAGKSTFADLLVGLYAPQSGDIRVGGVVRDLTGADGWRELLAYVAQDPFLSNDTVRNNLLWANPAGSDEDIREALFLAGADQLVAGMGGGLEAVVGERGALVSGGERQRLALARALMRQPKLLILDEATNALDVEGERRLLQRLRAARPHMTIVLIAHRLESLIHCDRVVLFEARRLVADGPFAQMSKQLTVGGRLASGAP